MCELVTVGTATKYGLDSPESESQEHQEIFLLYKNSRPASGLIQPSEILS
jgi:hypothetical protein